ncbi:hypothetical protein RB601_008226 [Gaeumannomyces tritici]
MEIMPDRVREASGDGEMLLRCTEECPESPGISIPAGNVHLVLFLSFFFIPIGQSSFTFLSFEHFLLFFPFTLSSFPSISISATHSLPPTTAPFRTTFKMQSKAIFVFALPVFAAPAPVMQQPGSVELATRSEPVAVAEAQLEKREIITGIVTSIAITVGTDLATRAANAGIKLIKDISNWTSAREKFTKATVDEMWAKNPDPTQWVAAICNNVGYNLKNPQGITGKVSVDLKQGALKTNYDCFYMAKGNTFSSTGDGGYINLATRNNAACKFTKGKNPSLAC